MFFGLVLALVGPAATASADEPLQLRNLPDTPTVPRFTLPSDRVWPSAPGQADVCLWDGDRFAAMSITIDDNCAPDHPWWTAQGALHDFKFTWFVITERPGTGPYWGTWDGWRAIHALGHDVQSHTVTHIHAERPGWQGIEWEYSQAIVDIETNIPGHKVRTLAYPGGSFSYLNDRNIAAQYYISARGVTGLGNKANQIDYFSVNVGGGIGRDGTDSVLFGTSGVPWLGGNKYLRGWLCVLFHGVAGGDKPRFEADLAYIKSKEADLWLASYTDVALYGQERDTAHLAVTSAGGQEIRFNISDDMDDTLFDYPLSIKVRLPDDWPDVAAVQNAAVIEASLVLHEGHKYALVKAVPDRGEVVLTPMILPLVVERWEVLADHGAAGTIATAVSDNYIERRMAGLRKLRVAFAASVDPATLLPAAVTIAGQTGGDQSSLVSALSVDASGREVTVTLSDALPNADVYTVTITDVLRSTEGDTVIGDRDIVLRTLAGDADGSGSVTEADLTAIRAKAGQAVDATTAAYDLDGSGQITPADLRAARRHLGSQLP